MLRTAFGAYGITSQAVVQFRRAPFHQLGMADQLGGRRFPSLDLLDGLVTKFQDLGMSEAVSRLQVSRLMRQQSMLLGLDDAFYVGAFVFFCLAGIVWLARPARLEKPEEKPTLIELEAEELMEQP